MMPTLKELAEQSIAELKTVMPEIRMYPERRTELANVDLILIDRELDSRQELIEILGGTLEIATAERNRLSETNQKLQAENERLYQSLIDIEQKLEEATK